MFVKIKMNQLMVIIMLLISINNNYAQEFDKSIAYPNYRKHPCKRECKHEKMACKYDFTIEQIYSMEPQCQNCLTGNKSQCFTRGCVVGDGKPRPMFTYNRMYPGPIIEVCQGDTIIVNLHNGLLDRTTSIHWHGIHQRGTQFMDGVPMVTQCPIQPMTTFQYKYEAAQKGTQFYHSHSFDQRSGGANGALVVKISDSKNPHKHLYDYDLSEHVICVEDYLNVDPDAYEFLQLRMKQDNDNNSTGGISVNGFARTEDNGVPSKRFVVKKGQRYRFRFVDTGTLICPIEIKIDNHKMAVISSDGQDVQPQIVDALYITNGERYDVIIEANQSSNVHWMRFKGILDCDNLKGYAILQYGDNDNQEPSSRGDVKENTRNDKILNCINGEFHNANCIPVSHLKPVSAPDQKLLKPRADFQYFIGFEVTDYVGKTYAGIGDNELDTEMINNISNKMPSSPYLQQPGLANLFCSEEHRYNCNSKNQCECPHGVKIPYDKTVELILVDQSTDGKNSHPFHLHGYLFQVVAMDNRKSGIWKTNLQEMDRNGTLKRNLVNPPAKDTIAVPESGYVVIRFRSDNPGFWFFHCHIEHHLIIGMSLVLKIGDFNGKFPKNFPTCGNFIPE